MKLSLLTILIFISISSATLGETWQLFTTDNSELKSSVFSEIIVDKNNITWVGTGNGLAKIEYDILSLYNKSNSILPSEYVTDLYLDEFNTLWILYKDRIYRHINNNFELYSDDIGGDEIVVTSKHQIIIGTGAYLIKLNIDNSLDTLYSPTQDTNYPIKDLVIDKNRTLWFSTYDNFGSLWKLSPDTTIQFTTNNIDLRMNAISYLTIDSMSNIWISGTEMILKYDIENNKWIDIIDEYSLNPNKETSFNAMAFNKNNDVYFVSSYKFTTPATLYSFSDNKLSISNFDTLYPESIFVKTQGRMAVDSSGNVIISASDFAIFKFNEGNTNVSTFEEEGITLFPNPTNDILNINLSNQKAISYTITNIEGKIIKQEHRHFNKHFAIDTKTLKTGTYFIKLKLYGEQIVQSKFVKGAD